MGRVLSGAYVDAQSAAAAYSRFAATHGADKATDALRHHPEQFGTLAVVERDRAFGLWISVDNNPPAPPPRRRQASRASGPIIAATRARHSACN